MTKYNAIFKTEDGSHSIHSSRFNESYHSQHGAIQESMHIFIESALKKCNKNNISILEVGFGTGLNAILSYIEAEKLNKQIIYETIELYPISEPEYTALNYCDVLNFPFNVFQKLHSNLNEIALSPTFILKKTLSDFTKIDLSNKYDIIYYDAFSPDIQPEMWTKEIFVKIYKNLNINGILTTYVSKGDVRRQLIDVGFHVEKLAGPIGKRHILRAMK